MFTELILEDGAKQVKSRQSNKRRSITEINEQIAHTGCTCISRDVIGDYKAKSAHGLYQLPCGHLQESKNAHIRDGKYKCKQCLLDRYEKEAAEQGMVILEHRPTDDADYKLYQLSCGHTKIAANYNVHKLSCDDCDFIERHDAAERNGLILLNYKDTSKWMSRNYQYKSCGHVQSMSLQRITKDDVPICSQCQLDRWQNEAAREGLEIIELHVQKSDNGTHKHLYKLTCGCEKLLTTGAVRVGVYGCDNHSTYWNKKSVLYLLKFQVGDFVWLKLGVSSNLPRRVNDYKIKHDYLMDKIKLVEFDTLANATVIEKQIHKKYKNSRLNPDLMRQYKDNGTTECYPLEMQLELLMNMEVID